jgi:hypothetical protein
MTKTIDELLYDPKRIKDLQELRSILSPIRDVIVSDDYCFCVDCVKLIFDLDKQYRVVTDYGLESVLDALRPPGMEHYQIHTGEDLLAFLDGYFIDVDDEDLEDWLEDLEDEDDE